MEINIGKLRYDFLKCDQNKRNSIKRYTRYCDKMPTNAESTTEKTPILEPHVSCPSSSSSSPSSTSLYVSLPSSSSCPSSSSTPSHNGLSVRSTVRQFILLVVLVALTAAATLTQRYILIIAGSTFLPAAAVFLAEVQKLGIALTISIGWEHGGSWRVRQIGRRDGKRD